MDNANYKAIFFDLDGTLLDLDMDLFLKEYFEGISAFFGSRGYDAKLFFKAIMAGVKSMTQEEGGCNYDRYWNTFCALTQEKREEMEPLFLEYYETDFNNIGKNVTPREEAREILSILKQKHYPLYLTTMPLFPRVAVEKRLGWAGCPMDVFDRITTYDNSTKTKPYLEYYQENVEKIGVDPSAILMIGNNTKEDLSCMGLGIDAYLVTDCLLDPIGFDIETVKHGSLQDLLAFVKALPDCE